MSGINYSTEKLNNIPIPEDGVSFGNISATGITPYLNIGNTIFSGSYGYETVTITLKGISIPPFTKPVASTIATQTFSFRNRTWHITDVVEGNKFNIGGQTKFSTWSVTGVDFSTPIIKI